MTIDLDMTSSIPIYLQIKNHIVISIGKGELKAGEYLPAVRQLACDNGVNMMTVSKAYSVLRSEGYIEIDRRHGAKICGAKLKNDEFKIRLSCELLLLIASSKANGLDKNSFIQMCENIFSTMNQQKVQGII